jgi:uncharacterized protein
MGRVKVLACASALLVLACSGSRSNSHAAAPRPEKPRLGKACAVTPVQASTNEVPRILLEVAEIELVGEPKMARLPSGSGGGGPNEWIDDPSVSVRWSTLVLAGLDVTSRIEWRAAVGARVQGELRLTPHLDSGSGPIHIEVDVISKGEKQGARAPHTTVVVANQQTVLLAVPDVKGTALAITPYLARSEAEARELRSCKDGPWVTTLSQPSLVPAAATAPPVVAAPPAALSYPKLELGGTLVRDLPASALTGKANRLIISVPASFQSEPERRYPVLFLLDGQWDFPAVNSTAGKLSYDKVFPEMLIVGLSYAGENPNYGELRADDYVPTRAKNRSGVEQGGGAPRFLEWFERELIPLVERDYRADPARRVLLGTSHGGLFTLFALFEKPELFSGYISVSPSVGWDGRYMFQREKQFRATHPELSRRLWLSSSSEERKEYVADELSFFRQLAASRYKNLSLKVHSVDGGRHASGAVEAYARALRFITEPWLESSAK